MKVQWRKELSKIQSVMTSSQPEFSKETADIHNTRLFELGIVVHKSL
jgi:hypothetical protein